MDSKKAIYRGLANYVTTVEERFHILHRINSAVFNDNLTIENYLPLLCNDLRMYFRPKKMDIFVISENRLFPVYTPGEDQPFLIESPDISIFPHEVLAGRVIVKTDWLSYQNSNTLFIPIHVSKGLKLLIIIHDDLPSIEASRYDISDNIAFAESISGQVSILLQHKIINRLNYLKSKLIDDFFRNELKPNKCWNIILDYIIDMLPDWPPLRINKPPRTQILTYNYNDRHIILQASKCYKNSGNEIIHTIRYPVSLKVNNTICGLAIERNTDAIYVNPQKEYTERYKGFLFGNEYPQSELVVVVRYDNEICALLNLEHMAENVFCQYHIEILLDFANFLGPFVNAIVARERRQRDKEISFLYIMTKIIQRMALTYRHKTSSLLIKSRYKISKLKKTLIDTQGEPYHLLNELSTYVNKYQEQSQSFFSDLPSFIYSGRVDLNRLVDEAIAEYDPEKSGSREKIFFIKEAIKSNYDVFASRMLREHIYNLIHNSVDAIREKISQGKITQGNITIRISRKKVKDALQNETSPARIYVEVQDNGGGVPPDIFPHIFDFGFTTKRKSGGFGFGLPAAREFMQSVAGEMEVENYFPDGFLVRIYLEEYTPQFHKPYE